MKKMKIALLLLSAALIILFSSCGAMMTETADVSIDLSSVMTKAISGADHVKIWLVADGTRNIYPLLNDQDAQDIGTDNTVKLTKIPAGIDFQIFMAIGTDDGVFTNMRSVTGMINVTGGSTSTENMTSAALKAAAFTGMTGKSVIGAAYAGNADSEVYTVKADGSALYSGDATGMTAEPLPFAEVVKFNDVDAGYDGDYAIVSAKATDGQALGTFDGTDFDFDFSDGLPAELPGTVDVLSSFIYNDTTNNLQLGISQIEGGIILSLDDGVTTEWYPVDFSELIEAAADTIAIDFGGEFFKGFAVMKQTETIDLYLASKIGNFKIAVPYDGSELGGADYEPLDFLVDFVTDNPVLGDRVILNLGNVDNEYLFVGTDRGLYKMNTATMTAATTTTYAANERIEMLECGADYTAAVTALKLIIINSDGATAEVGFNEGLPVKGLLNAASGGITGLSWNGSTLYIAGDYGMASLDAGNLF